MRKIKILLCLCLTCFFIGCNAEINLEEIEKNIPLIVETLIDFTDEKLVNTNLDNIPKYLESPYVILDNNIPNFTENELITESYEYYSDLDDLGRNGVAMACIGVDIMPTEERGSIGQVKPVGWHTIKYDCIDGMYLYNRCHLIGFQLTGENANKKNLMTGTRYLNVDGMLPFENMIANYVEETKNHVIYRVTPIYTDNNLIAEGVQMEAYSVEDNGEGICFNVFCYNVQPGIQIDYATGDSWLVGGENINENNNNKNYTANPYGIIYILNTNSKKYHTEDCGSANKITAENKEKFNGTIEWLQNNGYEPCGICKPQ